jgi:hypothetical protein
MRDLLDDIEILRTPALDLCDLSVGGVLFGAAAAEISRATVTEVTLARIVALTRGGTDGYPEYFAADGRTLTLEEVLDSVVASDGVVHLAERISFLIAGARVDGFCFWGSHLRRFDYLKTYAQFLAAFGAGDRVVPEVVYGDVTTYDHYYFGSRKHVSWDAVGDRISSISIGGFPGNDP